MSVIKLRNILQLVIATGLFMQMPDSVAGVFKCTGTDGRVSYQSRPCTTGNTQAQIKLRTHQTTTAASSTALANQNKASESKATPPEVVLYSTEWCGYCKKIRQLFADNNIAYKEYDIEKSATAKHQYDKLQGKGVPLTTIDGKLVRGFNRERLLKLAKVS